MKFDIIYIFHGGYMLYPKSHDKLISLGDICLYKENKKNFSCCWQNETFDYCNIENALCGKIVKSFIGGQHFIPKKIVVIQMK